MVRSYEKVLVILQNDRVGKLAHNQMKAFDVKMPLIFKPNVNNHSGKRMYRLTYGWDMYFTNACPLGLEKASHKGETDLQYLKKAIKKENFDLFISCGKQSNKACIDLIDEFVGKPLVFMPHPASRNLTNKLLDALRHELEKGEMDNDFIYKYLQKKKFHMVELVQRLNLKHAL